MNLYRRFSTAAVGLLLLAGVCSPQLYAKKWTLLPKAARTPVSAAASARLRAALLRQVHTSVLRQAAFRPTLWKTRQAYHFVSPAKLLPSVRALQSSYRVPDFPFHISDTEMYRGMALENPSDDLRHILKYGLEVSKSHFEAFGAYNGTASQLGGKGIYATTLPHLAQRYSLREDAQKPYLPVIVHLKRVGNESIVSIPHTIPPSWIVRISALLQINGKLVWGELKPEPNGQFIFTPYP